MNSAFFGLHVATSAMRTSRANLHTISHNIANAETQGFSRQVAIQQATTPLRTAMGRGMVGTGSEIVSIQQVRNQFLDGKFWANNSVLGQFNKKYDILTLVQGILHEAPGVGITHNVNDVFSRVSELGTDAGSATHRRNFLSSLETFGVTVNTAYSQLRQQQADLNQEIGVTVGIINSLGRQITSLNRQISVLELDGSNANDLRDQRALLIDQLSGLVNIEVREQEMNPDFAAGRTTDPRDSRRELLILIDGNQFVQHFNMNGIEVRPRTFSDGISNVARNPEEYQGMHDIFWSNGRSFNMYSPTLRGELAALINLRDGNGGSFGSFNTGSVALNPTGLTPAPGSPYIPGWEGTATNVLRMEFGPNSRVDLGNTGFITVRDTNGVNRQIRYTEFRLEFDANGNPVAGWFNLYDNDQQPAPLDFATILTAPQEVVVGRTTSYKGIPYFMARLNELVRTKAAAFNEGRFLNGESINGVTGHMEGYDLNGIPAWDIANGGAGFIMSFYGVGGFQNFAPPAGASDNWTFNYFNITAGNFMVNPALMADSSRLAIASDPSNTPSQNDIVHSWGAITEERGLFREGRLGDFIAAITGDLGITGRQAQNFSRSYTELMVTVENQRRAVSGVSMDEEVAHMIQHQLVFQAAARLFSVIDNIYDTMINRMGSWS
ncbi:MAG: flagellar hook-associated protein FlgK [Defluviitaleaceae bacterium]|nr:flagellar hook-associated protein FlgK [Defluviitaleaceae bacterium]